MMLFDDIERSERNSETSFEPLFRDINHYDWPGATRIRNRCESWFKKFPPEHRKDLRKRFRSDGQNRQGAFFELFLHELLTRLGFSLTVHPEITGAKRPDFLVCYDNQRFYLEATVTGQEEGPFTRNRNEQDVIDKLNTLTSPNFHITIHIEGTLLRTLSQNDVIRPFKELLDDHDPDEVQRLIDERGGNSAPSQRIECEDWYLEGWLRPISPDERKRKSNSTQRLILGYDIGAATDCADPVRKALKKKAQRYRHLDAPLAVAVNTRDLFYNGRDHDMDVLFGDQQLLYSMERPELSPQFGRKPNGVWSQDRRIDAFLSFQRVDFWNLWHNASACLYINPHNSNVALPDALFQLPHAKGYDGIMKWFEGVDIGQLVGVD